nr:DUF1427 family protein [Polymorphobacter fuscus]
MISLAIGIGVGLIYGVLKVRSPAPPTIALVGLLGMLLGEQAVPMVRGLFAPAPQARAADDTARARAADDAAGPDA